jgi:cytidine deaminase
MEKDRTYPCEDCGEVVTRRRKTKDPRICVPCGAARQVVAGMNMAAKQGPTYDAWQEAMRRVADRLEQ